MYKIVLSHSLCEEGMRLLQSQGDISVVVANESDPDKILPYLFDADAFILRIGKMTASMIEMCSKLKVIARPGVGFDTIDVGYAQSHGIPIVITPGENARSVAEHVFALLFSISKNLFESRDETIKGNYGIRNKYAAFELYGKSIGVVGFGHIGRIVAEIAKSLGMDVYVYDPYVDKEKMVNSGYVHVDDLSTLLSIAKVVTLHVASTKETRGMFSAKAFSMMQDGSILINCARGDLVDEVALLEALQSGKLYAAAEDLMQKEPFDIESPLLSLGNFIATPHMAALTRESAARCAVKAIEGVMAVLHGNEWMKVANPDVYKSEAWKRRKEEKRQ